PVELRRRENVEVDAVRLFVRSIEGRQRDVAAGGSRLRPRLRDAARLVVARISRRHEPLAHRLVRHDRPRDRLRATTALSARGPAMTAATDLSSGTRSRRSDFGIAISTPSPVFHSRLMSTYELGGSDGSSKPISRPPAPPTRRLATFGTSNACPFTFTANPSP